MTSSGYRLAGFSRLWPAVPGQVDFGSHKFAGVAMISRASRGAAKRATRKTAALLLWQLPIVSYAHA